MRFNKHISIVIPALNECRSIGRVIAEIPSWVDQIIVVDNGSIDGTDKIARSAGASVVYEPVKGYGAACLAGIAHARHSDIIGFIDGDYSDFPEDLAKVVEPVARGDVQLAIGSRQSCQGATQALPFHQKAGNWFACCLIHLLHGRKFADLGPMRCIDRKALGQLNMTDRNYGWTTEMQLKSCHLDINILEVPVRYRQRIGQSKISGTIKGSILAGYKILYWTVKLFLKGFKDVTHVH